MLYDVLSVWEVAHRWHGHDPNTTNPKTLPLPVQDTLRFLTRLLAYHELATCTEQGIEHWNRGQMQSFETFTRGPDSAETMSEGELWAAYEAYQENFENRARHHDEIVAGLEQCYHDRVYDKSRLDRIYVLQHVIEVMCLERDIALPAFWFPNGPINTLNRASHPLEGLASQETKPTALRPNQVDKLICQAIARTLWDIRPEMTIADLERHKAIRIYGNGQQYSGKNTLRDWLKEVDPRPEEKKRGRPRKDVNPDKE